MGVLVGFEEIEMIQEKWNIYVLAKKARLFIYGVATD